MPVGYPSNVLLISDYDKERFDEPIRFRVDFILSLGDNPMSALTDIYERYRKPIFAVRGERDGRAPFPKGVVNVHLQVHEYRNWKIGGFGGTLWHKDRGPNMWSDVEAEDMLDGMPACDILICHSPIASLTHKPGDDTYQGSAAIRTYISEKKPKIVYHGHVRENWGHRMGETAIVSVHGWKIVHL